MIKISPLDILIIYEDNHILVLEKPFNILTQKDETNDIDLVTLLKENLKIRYNKKGNVFVGLVHRLDRPVGGVMVFAKTSKAASRLSEQVREGTLKKQYYAIINGILKNKSASLVDYLYKDQSTNIVKVVSKDIQASKQAILEYEVIEEHQNKSLISVNLITGRSHQIRVQFSNIGHSLVGDQKYGENQNNKGEQICLWSRKICFNHPTTKEELSFEIMPPNREPWSLFIKI